MEKYQSVENTENIKNAKNMIKNFSEKLINLNIILYVINVDKL